MGVLELGPMDRTVDPPSGQASCRGASLLAANHHQRFGATGSPALLATLLVIVSGACGGAPTAVGAGDDATTAANGAARSLPRQQPAITRPPPPAALEEVVPPTPVADLPIRLPEPGRNDTRGDGRGDGPDPEGTTGDPGDGAGAGPVVGLDLDLFAPFAEQVFVAGTFNHWTPELHPLVPRDDGRWFGRVDAARVGDTYKVVLDTAAGRLWKNDPRARAVTNSVGESVVVSPALAPAEPFNPAPWNTAVIYELHIGTFVDEPGGGPGNFDDAVTRLDTLAALGVTHLKVMPVAEFAGDFSWGYNPAHPFAVESAYGGLDAMRRFVSAAHARGLGVILDVVYNHFGPGDLDLWRFDGWHDNDLGGVYFYNDDRAETPWGHTRPDYGRSAVRAYLTDNALYWLSDVGVDGLRFDSTGNIRARRNGGSGDIPEGWEFLRAVNASVDALPTWKVMIAEDLGGLAAITEDVSRGGAGFDAQWDPGFVHPVRQVLTAVADEHRSMGTLRRAIAERVDADPFGRIVYTESHDEVANGRARVPEEVWPGNADVWFARQRALLGLVLTLTTPGVPMVFQGQEFLEDGWFSDTDPLDWSKLERNHDVWSSTRELIALRRNVAGHTRGLTGPHVNVFRADEDAKVLAWHRFAEGGADDDVVIVARFRDGSPAWVKLGFPHCGVWTIRAVVGDPDDAGGATGDTLIAGPEGADGLACSAWLELGPYAAVILSRD
jgi:1,4-alpha-glucan branching enzyme